MPLVYDQLRRVAHRHLGAEPTGHTLSATALVHEAYLRLVDQIRVQWQDRAHFFAIASRAMRRILIDYARRHRALRRGGVPNGPPPSRISLDEVALPVEERAEALLVVDEALERLGQVAAGAGGRNVASSPDSPSRRPRPPWASRGERWPANGRSRRVGSTRN